MLSKCVVETLVVFSLAWPLFYFLQFQAPYINGYDGYYHIKYAWLLRQQGIIQEFPWAQFSLWRDHFADKEFLFHVLLIPFTWFDNLASGAKHATVFFASVFVANFNLLLRLHRIPLRYLWLLLLLIAGDVFLYRLHLPRPHLLSMTFMLWLVHATVRQRYILLAVLSAIYVHTYTALHMPIVLGIIFCAGQLLMREKINWKSLQVPVLAVLCSALVSPFFPRNLTTFYVQNLELVWQNVFLQLNLDQGSELKPLPMRYLLFHNLSLMLPLCGALYLQAIRPRQLSRESQHLLAFAAVFLMMTMISKRFIEYCYPIGLLFCACYYRDRWGTLSMPALLRQARLKSWLAVVTVVVLLGTNAVVSYSHLVRGLATLPKPSKYEQAAQFLQQNTAAGATVFTCDWDDSPELFYFNHHNYYVTFMDPLFMYSWSPHSWYAWKKISLGSAGKDTAGILFNNFKVEHGICTSDFTGLRKVIDNEPHLSIIYEDEHTYVFKVTAPPDRNKTAKKP